MDRVSLSKEELELKGIRLSDSASALHIAVAEENHEKVLELLKIAEDQFKAVNREDQGIYIY